MKRPRIFHTNGMELILGQKAIPGRQRRQAGGHDSRGESGALKTQKPGGMSRHKKIPKHFCCKAGAAGYTPKWRVISHHFVVYLNVSFSVKLQKVTFLVRCRNPGHIFGPSATKCWSTKSWSPGFPKGKTELFVLLNIRHHSQRSEKGGGSRQSGVDFREVSKPNISGAWFSLEGFR